MRQDEVDVAAVWRTAVNTLLAIARTAHDAEQSVATLIDEGEHAAIRHRKELDAAYDERNRLVAALAGRWPTTIDVPHGPDWPVVYVDSPAGQLSWHLPAAFVARYLRHVPRLSTDWDGHSTAEKYDRLAAALAKENQP